MTVLEVPGLDALARMMSVQGSGSHREATMLKVGDKCPSLPATSYDGRTFDVGALGNRTVLWFSPKGGVVDEVGDKLYVGWSP